MTSNNLDEALIQKARTGDQRAFRQLYDRNVVPLYRFLRQFAVSTAETEEWVQRTFIKAFGSLDAFRGDSKFSSWIIRIGINEMRMDKRKHSFAEPMENGFDISAVDDQSFEWEHSMTQWLHDLGELQRMVFVLYEVEGFSHAEIAGMLEIGESTSRTLLSRAKHYLRKCWSKEMH
jgi:RNA polymerase sigma-70 factor (ECF subfamily)